MRALSESRALRFFAFGALYFAQGVPWGFVSVGYVVFMADQGLSNTAVGEALALAYLPWSFKWLAGPLIDALPVAKLGWERRRPFIIGAELLMALTMLSLAFVGDLKSQLALASWILLAHNVCAALQDVAVDALAVDILAADERGRANSIMWSAKAAGNALGGGGGLVVAKYLGWPTLMVIMAAMVALVMLIPIFVRERPRGQHIAHAQVSVVDFAPLLRSFSFPAPLVGFLIAFLCPIGFSLIPAFSTRMYRADLHFSEEQLGALTGVAEPIVGALGALLGGFLADRLGTKKTMAAGLFGTAMLLAVFGATRGHWASFPFVLSWTIGFNLFVYVYQAASLGFFMTLANPAIGATHFALYMATTNFCYSVTSKLGGGLADELGYEQTYFLAAGCQMLAIVLIPLCNVREAERRFHQGAPAERPLPPAPAAVSDPGT